MTKQEYITQLEQAERNLKAISKLLNSHNNETKGGETANWEHIGDLQYLNSLLEQSISYFEGDE